MERAKKQGVAGGWWRAEQDHQEKKTTHQNLSRSILPTPHTAIYIDHSDIPLVSAIIRRCGKSWAALTASTANDILKIIIISSAKPRSSREAALNEPRSGQISLTSSQHDNDTVSCPRDDSLGWSCFGLGREASVHPVLK
ncbi:unnamed protein product [Leuciscus chuanchicus]